MRALLIAILLVQVSAWLHAQAVLRTVPAAMRGTTATRAVTPMGRGAVEAAASRAYMSSLSTTLPMRTVASRPWLTQQIRDLQAWELKREHTAKIEQDMRQQAYLTQLQARLDALPQPQTEQAFAVSSLDHIATDAALPIPAVPALMRVGYLYRGLGLPADGQAVRHILENGLLVADAGPDANHLMTSWSTNDRGGVQDFKAMANTKLTNLTKDPLLAVGYARRNAQSPDKIVTLLSVTGQTAWDNVVRVYEDIPATNIDKFFALLKIGEHNMWCQIEITDAGDFLVTPYR
ncbi:MAG: hypothetical protein IJ876_03855 [Elusimicrobiaceae bacterium]|nr:hypothetical protein [Elusimicrobiaceae bacterium]